MSFFHLGPIGRLAMAATLLACAAGPGCVLRQPHHDLAPPAKDPPAKSPQQNPLPAQTASPKAAAATVSPGVATDRSALAHREWIQAVPPRESLLPEAGVQKVDVQKADAAKRPALRWRNPGLEELLARPASHRVDFHPYLSDSDAVVAANAAIGLARSGDTASADPLVVSVETLSLPTPMRCAAVEALATLTGPVAIKRLRELMDQFGDVTPASGSAYQADLHAELVRGLARHIDAADDPRLSSALQSPSVEVRVAALHAWAAGHRGILPQEVAKLRNDGNPRVRCATLEVLVARQHPDARQYLSDALRDCDLQVRVTAIGSLGNLGDGQAIATLADLLKDRSDRMRSEAVTALAHAGAKQIVLGAAGDASWRVRLRVAQALAAYPDREGVGAATTMLNDQSAEVQRQAVLSAAQWPLALSGPILLEALGKDALLTRKTAADRLTALWPAAAEFPADALPQRRAEALQQLQDQFRQWRARPDQAAAAGYAAHAQHVEPVADASPSANQPTAAEVQRVEQLLRADDTKALAEIGPELLVTLEQLAVERHQVLPESVYHSVLPRHSAAFRELDQLHSKDIPERRLAAAKVASLAKKQPLGRLAVTRLCELTTAESDPLVWQNVLDAVAADSSEPASRLASTALGHSSPEVRRRACQWLAAHPAATHAQLLLPLLHDSSLPVVIEAVRALGACDRIDDLQPLRQLLGASNEELQLETALALVRLGDGSGTVALDRLAYSEDPAIRTRVAQAMGELGSSSSTATLVRLLDDRRTSVSRAALASLPKTAGRDVAKQADPGLVGTTEQIRRWKRWFADEKPTQ